MLTDLFILRESRRISQRELAQKSGLSKTAIQRIETGRAVPGLDTVFALARGLCINVHELIDILAKEEDFAKRETDT